MFNPTNVVAAAPAVWPVDAAQIASTAIGIETCTREDIKFTSFCRGANCALLIVGRQAVEKLAATEDWT
jgi:hypothetical protein